MRIWDDIVTAALIGTERQGFTPPNHGGPLGDALRRVAAASPEASLLGCAALASAYARAGMSLPEHAGEMPTTAPEEDRPACPPEAGRKLLALLSGEDDALRPYATPLLREWLAAASGAGRLVPPNALPLLLEEGKGATSLRPAIAPLLGRRGAWLARLNPEWAYAVGAAVEDGEAAWTEGTLGVRTEFLRRQREADPTAARERLAADWKREPVEARKAFLAVLAAGLSPADEPFLESMLDDRSKVVRQVAADLLCALPGSQFARRMAERAQRFVRFEKKLLGGWKMIVELPESFDAAAQRDGLEEQKSIKETVGRKGAMLRQVIALTPLEHWTAGNGLEPGALIALARKTDWAAVILGGWAEAARRQRDGAWSLALLNKVKRQDNEYEFEALLETLDPPRLEQFMLEALRQDPRHRLGVLHHLLKARNDGLSPEATRAILPELKQNLAGASYDWRKTEVLMAVALRGAPCCYPEARAMAQEVTASKSEWVNMLEKFLAVYEFRHILHKEFER